MRQVLLDDRSYELAERLASRKQVTVSQAVADAIHRSWETLPDAYAIIGCLAGEVDLLDGIVEGAMLERESRPLRLPDG